MNKRGDHPLIQREQTYALDRKLLSVHSEDRDINKWPNANHFELQLPQTYVNVETISVVEYSFPIYYNTFSNENQNTKLTVKVFASGTDPLTITITISSGFYGPIQLATELQNRLNLAVNSTYTNFKVFYDEVRQRLLFGNVKDPFTFVYNAPEKYDREPCHSASQTQPQSVRWNHGTRWGLAYNLGFVKYLPGQGDNTSVAAPVGSSQSVYYTNLSESTAGHMWLPVATGVTGYVLVPPNPPSLNGDSAIYLEIDKCNHQDEMQPYTENNGIVNAAFAKLMIQSKPLQILDSCQYQYSYDPPGASQGMVSYSPPLDKLSKLKFKFRYHDGTLVDFGGLNFNFTIGVYCMRDEIARANQMRTPYMQ